MVRDAAAELPEVTLEDALRIRLLIRDRDPERVERAAHAMGRDALPLKLGSPLSSYLAVDARAVLLADPDEGVTASADLPKGRSRLGGAAKRRGRSSACSRRIAQQAGREVKLV